MLLLEDSFLNLLKINLFQNASLPVCMLHMQLSKELVHRILLNRINSSIPNKFNSQGCCHIYRRYDQDLPRSLNKNQ